MWPAIPFEWVADFLDHMDALNFAKSSGVAAKVVCSNMMGLELIAKCESTFKSPLHVVMAKIMVLIDQGGGGGNSKTSALLEACGKGHVSVAMALLDKGADAHAKDKCWMHSPPLSM